MKKIKKYFTKFRAAIAAFEMVLRGEKVMLITDKTILTDFSPVQQYTRLKFMLKKLREKNTGLTQHEIDKAEKALYEELKKAAKPTAESIKEIMKAKLN